MSYAEVIGVRTGFYSVLVLSRGKKTQISTVMERDQEKVDPILIHFFLNAYSSFSISQCFMF